MKITFRQSGGYAGLIMGCEIDTASMKQTDAELLQSLVERSGILELQEKERRAPKGRDLLHYEIHVETGKDVYEISFDDMSIPDNVIPLLEYLKERSGPLPPK